MADTDHFEIEIYNNGVHFKLPIRGKKRYLIEKAFLNNLTGVRVPASELPRPAPDPGRDSYALNDEELQAYSDFRKRVRR